MLRIVLLSPVLAVQALWVVLRATRLPEAAGPRQGRIGKGPPLRVLVLGDSSAAGVGVAQQSEALGGQLAQALSDSFEVTWQVIAKSGGTAASTSRLIQSTQPATFDVVVTALGVNDAKNGVRKSTWRVAYQNLIDDLHARAPQAHVYVSGVAPLGEFPLLPNPLRRVLGVRAQQFDAILQQIAAAREAVTHMAFDLPLETDKMAGDGFHPGPEVYAYWAQMMARQIAQDQASRGKSTGVSRR